MSADVSSADQFISALVKNLQAVCHGHVEFDKNVKVVGHLYLTVDDSNSEFNYIVNEKVSKSDESSTTFISKSFYATDPQQKTPKKNVDRPLPPPTPNVLGKTRYDISVDLTDDHSHGTMGHMGGGRYPQMPQRGQFSRPQGYPGSHPMHRTPPRRRPLDQTRLSPQQIAKIPRLSSPQRHPLNFPSTSPRKMLTSPSQRILTPSSIISSSSPSISSDIQTVRSSPIFIPPESVSATPAHSLPGADKPESIESDPSEKTGETADIKFEIIKVENGNVVASDKSETEGEEGELKIASVTSHDLSFVPETSTNEKDQEKESETNQSEASESDKPDELPTSETVPSENKDDPCNSIKTTSPNELPPSSSERPPSSSDILSSNEPEVIEIDLTTVKDEIDYSSNYLDRAAESINDEEFFTGLQEKTADLYPVRLHFNDSNHSNPNTALAHNLHADYLSEYGASSSATSQPVKTTDMEVDPISDAMEVKYETSVAMVAEPEAKHVINVNVPHSDWIDSDSPPSDSEDYIPPLPDSIPDSEHTNTRSRRPRRSLTLKEKVELINSAGVQSQRTLARIYKIGKTQVGTIMRRKEEILEYHKKNSNHNLRKRLCKDSDLFKVKLDSQLTDWIENALSKKEHFTGTDLRLKALEYAKQLGMTDFKASNGWLYHFKTRHNIVLTRPPRGGS